MINVPTNLIDVFNDNEMSSYCFLNYNSYYFEVLNKQQIRHETFILSFLESSNLQYVDKLTNERLLTLIEKYSNNSNVRVKFQNMLDQGDYIMVDSVEHLNNISINQHLSNLVYPDEIELEHRREEKSKFLQYMSENPPVISQAVDMDDPNIKILMQAIKNNGHLPN